jgi:hypothetical protein
MIVWVSDVWICTGLLEIPEREGGIVPVYILLVLLACGI